ncbi:TPA: TrlF family AAA-like ATPase, partial [Listeria monocytogenes]
ALAFKDFKNRISLEKSTSSHGFIRSVEFLGGKLDGKKIYLSPELNCLIGIRGSGKSSIIEAIRYALDIPPSNSDNDYKREVVKNLLGSGGQVILELQDNYGNLYRIKRILGEDPHVTDMDDKGVGAKIGSILSAPLYFGQKDLSAMDNGFELTLLDKIVGEVSGNFETQISNIEERISSKMKGFINLENKINNGGELEKDLSDIKHKIKIFEEKGLSDKLSKQVNFQQDKATIDNVNTLVGKYIQALQNIISSEELSMLIKLEKSNSQEVPELFEKLRIEIKKVTSTKNKIEEIIQEVKDSKSKLVEFSNEMNNTITSLEEEFAEIKREIDIPNLNPDDFSALKLRETKIEEAIEKIDQQENEKNKLVVELNELVQERNDTLLKELEIYKNEINRINQSQTSLKLHITFKGDKKEFLTQLKDSFKGTSVSTSSYEQITGKFPDFTSLVIDILLKDSEKISQILPDTHLTKVKQRVREEYSSYLKHKTPNNITINYHGKPITNHSIGQRASALVLFILSQKNNNLIMIDQPEDDLDNQVIYNEIIKEIKSRKPDVQFIFATHNANIPVLGDSEQIISVSYDDEGITTDTGSIDSKLIQNKIVDIMEGGHEAFNRRTEIYNLWRN